MASTLLRLDPNAAAASGQLTLSQKETHEYFPSRRRRPSDRGRDSRGLTGRSRPSTHLYIRKMLRDQREGLQRLRRRGTFVRRPEQQGQGFGVVDLCPGRNLREN